MGKNLPELDGNLVFIVVFVFVAYGAIVWEALK